MKIIFLVTLRGKNVNIEVILGEKIEFLGIFGCLIEFIVVKEIENNGEIYFYIYIENFLGIEENNLKEQLKKLKLLGVQIKDVQSLKSNKGILKYLFKNLTLKELLEVYKRKNKRGVGIQTEKVYVRSYRVFVKLILKDKYYKNIIYIFDIIEFKFYEEWFLNFSKSILFSKDLKHLDNLWKISRNCLICSRYMSKFDDQIKLMNLFDNLNYDKFFQRYLGIVNKYRVSYVYLELIKHLLYCLILREGKYPFLIKQKNIIVRGLSNTEKIFFLNKFINLIGQDIFYFVGSNESSLLNYKNFNKPILVWNNVLDYLEWKRVNLKGEEEGWCLFRLQKFFNHEDLIVRKECGAPVYVFGSRNIIFTKCEFLFKDYNNESFNVGGKIIYLNFTKVVNWDKIRLEEFKVIVLYNYWKLNQELYKKNLNIMRVYGSCVIDFIKKN